MKSRHWLSNLVPLLQYIVKSVEAERVTIDNLNVFPIPDGDTGTNVKATLAETLADVMKLPHDTPPDELLGAISRSIIRRSRGNSGVILAGMIRGATEALRGTKKPTVEILAHMLHSADAGGRKAIIKPTEGTMITVVRVMATEAIRLHRSGETSLSNAAEQIVKVCIATTKATHKDMAILTNVDQIDSGAYAISVIVRAIYEYTTGKTTQSAIDGSSPIAPQKAAAHTNWKLGDPRYCTEFLWHPRANLRRKPIDQAIQKYLSTIGNSVEYLASEDFAKIHVHTDAPHRVLAHFLSIGEISETAVHNMRLQTEEHQRILASTRKPPKPLGVVAVASGSGMQSIMRELGADIIVDGGQTQNPTTGDIAAAISSVNAECVIVLPSNKNIILAATTASQLVGKPSAVIPTTNMPQSFNALLALTDYSIDATTDLGELTTALAATALSPNIAVASIAVATNDYTSPTLLHVRQGQFIVIVGDEVAIAHDGDVEEAIFLAIRHLTVGADPDRTVLTVYTGADYTGDIDNLQCDLLAEFNMNPNIIEGDQPIFHAIIEVVVNPT